MKKFLAVIIAILLALSLSACGPAENTALNGSEDLSFNTGAPCVAYVLHDSKYNKDYIVVRLYDNSVAITPRLK